MVVSSVKLREQVKLGVVNSILLVDAPAKGSLVRGRGWGSPGIRAAGRRGSASNVQGSKKSVRQEENVLLNHVVVETKTRQMSFSVRSLDRIFYSLPG